MAASIAIVLVGCEVRQSDQHPDPAANDTAPTIPVPADTETAAASIIREDAGGDPAVILPPEPLRVTIPFAEGGTAIGAQAEHALAGVLKSAQIKQDWPIILAGHTDSAGNDQANLRASRSRAEAVAAWLVERGVPDGRIEVIGFGEQNPIAPNALPDGKPNETGRMRNRRVDITIQPPPPPLVKQPALGAPIADATGAVAPAPAASAKPIR